jgi:hypothetical protein
VRFIGSLSALLVCALLVGCGEGSTRPAETCSRYCVSVEPKDGNTETVFKFRGRGWRANRPVEALYGVYCQPTKETAKPNEPVRGVCFDIGYTERFQTDNRGRFTFRFRNGPGPRHTRDIPPPSAQGGGPPTFEQWSGRAYRSRLIRRTWNYRVNGELPGPRPPNR